MSPSSSSCCEASPCMLSGCQTQRNGWDARGFYLRIHPGAILRCRLRIKATKGRRLQTLSGRKQSDWFKDKRRRVATEVPVTYPPAWVELEVHCACQRSEKMLYSKKTWFMVGLVMICALMENLQVLQFPKEGLKERLERVIFSQMSTTAILAGNYLLIVYCLTSHHWV